MDPTDVFKQSTGSFDVALDPTRGPQGVESSVHISVNGDFMALVADLPGNVRVASHFGTDDEERRPVTASSERSQDPTGCIGMRAIIEGQRHPLATEDA
jgi:hypothetical protein